MNKAVFHSVLHIMTAALVLVQLLYIADLKESNLVAMMTLHKAEYLVMEAAEVCGFQSPSRTAGREQ